MVQWLRGYGCATRGRTILQLSTLFKNPGEEQLPEIEVTDPTHPLFGRRFPLVSQGHSPQETGHAFVRYHQTLILRIPLQATTLASPRPAVSTRLTVASVQEILELAEDCEISCRFIPSTYGND